MYICLAKQVIGCEGERDEFGSIQVSSERSFGTGRRKERVSTGWVYCLWFG